MAISYDDLVILIGDTIPADDETTFVSHIDDFIDQTEDLISKNCQLPVMTKTASSTLTASSEYLVLPDDYLAPLQLAVISASTRYQLKFKDSSFLTQAYPGTTTGLPKFYSQGNEAETARLRMRPIPDSAYTYELEYSARPASLVDAGGANTTWISTNMKNALVYGCLMHGALYIRDFEGAKEYERQFMQAAGLTKIEQEGKARTDRRRRDYARPDVQE